MSEILTTIREHTPSLLLKLFQRRLLDKNAEITTEELLQVADELDDERQLLQYKIDRFYDKHTMFRQLVDKKDLNSVTSPGIGRIIKQEGGA